MIDHVTLNASDYARSREFYRKALAPLGWRVEMEFDEEIGFGVDGHPFFWLRCGEAASPVHVAFRCADRARVDAFHAAALKAGGEDNGVPGLRPHYHDNYYGAFILDPDGNNIEAVCHRPE
ncbi:MAG: VOC family protein [Gemmatimonadetes bacterium]|nr:VOC family protein [Gemmatimonadota bacterium]